MIQYAWRTIPWPSLIPPISVYYVSEWAAGQFVQFKTNENHTSYIGEMRGEKKEKEQSLQNTAMRMQVTTPRKIYTITAFFLFFLPLLFNQTTLRFSALRPLRQISIDCRVAAHARTPHRTGRKRCSSALGRPIFRVSCMYILQKPVVRSSMTRVLCTSFVYWTLSDLPTLGFYCLRRITTPEPGTSSRPIHWTPE